MVRLRTILAENLRAYRKERELSQFKLADIIDSAPNYIAMIEAEKRFPTDTMLEKIAIALKKEPYELFAITPIQQDWKKTILSKMSTVIDNEINAVSL